MANPKGTPRNLRRFPKGTSGNPGGRPRGVSLTRFLYLELAKPSAEDPSVTNAELVARRVVEMAIDGDLGAIREVLDRTEGKAVARTEHGEPGAFDELADKSIEELCAMLRSVD